MFAKLEGRTYLPTDLGLESLSLG